ncbi:chromate efflux transporter [uncultured Devosia sp.]|uniref:chromate efflux transporter n=1 Tax=uncultured Devosia sp. TaxID=211434 RepID=UPI0035CC23D5
MTQHSSEPLGTPLEVFMTFLQLGLTAFGGPIAHLGYFRDELVVRRQWIDEAGYADLVALCQFLPGPASSQVGFAMGLLRGGPLGALAAWLAFTLPSAVLLVTFALGAALLDGPIAAGLLHGLKIVAVAVVAQAVLGMARTLTPDRQRAAIAVAAIAVVVFVPVTFGQIAAIVLGGVVGTWLCRDGQTAPIGHLQFPISRRFGVMALAGFIVMLLGLPLLSHLLSAPALDLASAFYRSGALVFGGGHVVLPLLQAEMVAPGWVAANDFLAGYGAAQAMPGPLFAFSAYLGAVTQHGPNGIVGAALCLVSIFLPGFLLLVGALPFWDSVRTRPLAQAAMRGANAAVVGLLAAALYDPVWTGAILRPADFALAAAGFVALTVWKFPPWTVVVLLALGGVGLGAWP